MPTTSYAQNREDVLLARVFREPTGFYIDVGAAHPVYHSVTNLFYQRGWSGVNVEPQPAFFAAVAAERSRDVNLNAAVSDAEGECTFHEVQDSLGCSTVNPDLADHLRRTGSPVVSYTVRTLTLRQICEAHAHRQIDILKIDAEGHERAVIAGGDFRRWRPRVVVVETTAHETWEPLILSYDYLFAFFDGLNRYYVRSEDRHLIPALAVPVSVLDDYVPFEYEQRIRELEHALATARRAA
jgi:FkbM family methyltransferase